MKLELPFAIGLLALGYFVWASPKTPQIEGANQSAKASQIPVFSGLGNDSRPLAGTTNPQSKLRIHHPENLVAASFEEAVNQGSPSSNGLQSPPIQNGFDKSRQALSSNLSDSSEASPTDRPQLDSSRMIQKEIPLSNSQLDASSFLIQGTASSQSTYLVARAGKAISNSKPFGTPVSIQGRVFGQVVSANGQYFQMGQGSERTRMELRFEPLQSSPLMIQLCDGRFVYSIQSRGNEHEFEYVDSDKIKRKAIKFSPTPDSQIGLVSTGGISGLLDQLVRTFQFNHPRQMPDGTMTIRGSWQPEKLKQLLAGSKVLKDDKGGDRENKQAENNQTLNWNAMPSQIPHAVEIQFSSTKDFELIPSRISFLQFAGSKESFKINPFVSIGFGPPQIIEDLDEKYFIVDSRNLESNDTTDHYLARMKFISNTAKQAAIANREKQNQPVSVER